MLAITNMAMVRIFEAISEKFNVFGAYAIKNEQNCIIAVCSYSFIIVVGFSLHIKKF